MPITDYDLLHGDSDSFAVLYERHDKDIRKLLWAKKLTFVDDIDDILQQVWSRVYKKRDMYNPKWKFKTWLCQVAIRVAINFNRAKSKWNSMNIPLKKEISIDITIDSHLLEPLEILLLQETKNSVREAINNLTLLEYEAIKTVYFETKSPSKSQRSYCRRARRKLHKKLRNV